MVKSELEKLTDCEIAIACHCNFSSTANPQPPNTASHCLPYKCMKAPPGQCNSQTSRDELIVVVVTTHLNSAVSFSSITLKQLGVRQQLQLGRSRVVFCTEISSEVELQYVSELMKSAHVIHFLSSSHSHLAWRSQPSKSQSHWGENHRQKCIQIKSSHQPISSHSSLYQVSPTSTPSSPSLCFHFRHLRHLSTSPKPSAAPLRRLHDLFEGRHAHHGVPKVQLQQLRAKKAALATAGSGRCERRHCEEKFCGWKH